MKKLTIALISSASLAIAACGGADDTAELDTTDEVETVETVDEGNTIVDVASGNDDFSTLVAAVTQAELGETLAGDGPYTVFAPNNAAFDKVDSATLDGLMSGEQQEALQGILTYHVVSGETMAADLTSAIEEAGGTYEIATIGGGNISASIVDGNVVLTDAAGNTSTVVSTDVDASNGVIHVIDTVLMPQ